MTSRVGWIDPATGRVPPDPMLRLRQPPPPIFPRHAPPPPPYYAQSPEDIWGGFALNPRQPVPSWAQTAPSLAPPTEQQNPFTGQEKVTGGPDARYAYMQKGRKSLEWQNFVPWYTSRYGRAPIWGSPYETEWQDFLTGASAPAWLQPRPTQTQAIINRVPPRTRSVSRWGVEYPGLGDVWAGLSRNSAPAGLTTNPGRLY